MKFPILAMLAAAPAHGYDLKQQLEGHFGAALPPLNTGQIYTALARLERDGLVEGGSVEQNRRPTKRVYSLTDAGREALSEWVRQPSPGTRQRDEFFMKLVLAGRAGIADPHTLIERQRREYLQALRDLDRLTAAGNGDVAESLLIEGAALHLEADLKWLALCEQRLTEEVTDGQRASD
jgi:DNA-binding PadR family transcriptional regulator